jgi:integrase
MTILTTPKARARLTPRGKPYFVPTVTPGIALGYRRLEGRAGTWTARIADGKGGNRLQALGVADDLEQGGTVLTYEQAQDAARKVNQAPEVEGRLTVERALTEYAASDQERHPGNVSRVRYWLGEVAPGLLAKDLGELTVNDLEGWRDGIKRNPATVNRTIRILKTALTGAADRYPERGIVTNAWRVGLKQKKHKHKANNVVLSDNQVRELVAAAYRIDPAFGLFVEVGAVTGARPSQIARLEVGDLQLEPTPRLNMPTSDKGSGEKASHIMVPITASLASKLRSNRGPSEPLLMRTQGDAWSASSSDHRRPFEQAVAELDVGKRVTFYALRHSSIVRRIMLGVPLREIAAIHDTSVVMIERHYSKHIDQYGDSVRVGLLDLGTPVRDNVVAMR